MSWTHSAVIIAGYKIAREAWEEGAQRCANSPEALNTWEDYFIDLDPCAGDGDTFFGSIIYEVDEYEHSLELSSISPDDRTINAIVEGFQIFFPNNDHPPLKLYIGTRWI